jgi:triosephosphate isomerase
VTLPAARRLIVGNWKMNLGERAARDLVTSLRTALPFDRVDAAVAPAFPCLRAALDAAAGSPLAVAAQNLHWEERGAFTGEVAASMLAEMGVRFVIVGHSERRALFGETDATVARKVAAAQRHGLAPILCIGETEAERARELTKEVIVAQLRAGLAESAASGAASLVIAYEPVWAIGTGRTPAPTEVTTAHRAIRAALLERLGEAGGGVRILYGGSATAATAAALLGAPEVGGALVGGASLDAAAFRAIAALD